MPKGGSPVTLRHAFVERLMHYYHILLGLQSSEGAEHFRTDDVGRLLGIDASQVRKDMARIHVTGRPRVGFETDHVIDTIKDALGLTRPFRAVIVGAGRLGGALASYEDFAGYGLELVGAFDIEPGRMDAHLAGRAVQPMSELESSIERLGVELAIITVPRDGAQSVADRLVAAGVRAIWNFAPGRISVPDGVFVRDEHIAVGLGEIAHHLNQ